MTAANNRPTKAAAKKRPAKAAAVRHHTDRPRHPAEVDINMQSNCPELKLLLKLLRPMLKEVIKASRKCKHHHHPPGKFVGRYHNITFCDGAH